MPLLLLSKPVGASVSCAETGAKNKASKPAMIKYLMVVPPFQPFGPRIIWPSGAFSLFFFCIFPSQIFNFPGYHEVNLLGVWIHEALYTLHSSLSENDLRRKWGKHSIFFVQRLYFRGLFSMYGSTRKGVMGHLLVK